MARLMTRLHGRKDYLLEGLKIALSEWPCWLRYCRGFRCCYIPACCCFHLFRKLWPPEIWLLVRVSTSSLTFSACSSSCPSTAVGQVRSLLHSFQFAFSFSKEGALNRRSNTWRCLKEADFWMIKMNKSQFWFNSQKQSQTVIVPTLGESFQIWIIGWSGRIWPCGPFKARSNMQFYL